MDNGNAQRRFEKQRNRVARIQGEDRSWQKYLDFNFLLDMKLRVLFHHGMPRYVTGKVAFDRMAKMLRVGGCRCCQTFAHAAGTRGADLSPGRGSRVSIIESRVEAHL